MKSWPVVVEEEEKNEEPITPRKRDLSADTLSNRLLSCPTASPGLCLYLPSPLRTLSAKDTIGVRGLKVRLEKWIALNTARSVRS